MGFEVSDQFQLHTEVIYLLYCVLYKNSSQGNVQDVYCVMIMAIAFTTVL